MVKLYEFDGEQLSAGQISKRYPAYSDATIAVALREGCRSLADLQARDRRCKANIAKSNRENGKRGAKIVTSPGGRNPHHYNELASMGLKS